MNYQMVRSFNFKENILNFRENSSLIKILDRILKRSKYFYKIQDLPNTDVYNVNNQHQHRNALD